MTNPPPVEPPQQPAEPERPRFGEYASPAEQQNAMPQTAPPQNTQPEQPYARQQPQYTQPAQQNPYGQPHPYGQQPLYSHENPYGAAPGAPRAKGLGVTAFVLGLIVLVASPIIVAITASAFAPVLEKAYTGSGSVDPNLLSETELSQIGGASFGFLAYLIIGTILGLWALIQGIVAAARNRGRAFGILAIVFSVAAPIVGVITFYAVILAGAPGLVEKMTQGV